MGHSDEHLPEDVRDIAARLSEARATLSPLELDDLRSRVTRPAASRRAGRLRRSTLVAMLAGALMLTSGAGVVIAAGYFGGGDRYVFQTTSFSHDHDASFCQYHGPVTITHTIPTPFGIYTITITYDCGRVIAVHISFVPFHFPPPHGGHGPFPCYGNPYGIYGSSRDSYGDPYGIYGDPRDSYGNTGYFGPGYCSGGGSEPWQWSFGNGPEQSTSDTSVSTTAPTDTTGMTIAVGGSTYTLPFDFTDSSAPLTTSNAASPTTGTTSPTGPTGTTSP
jgi:hypothetical protein